MVAMNIINLYENYNSYFNADYKAIFELCSKIASDNGYKLYLIGGLVRDMLLKQKSLDIDITIEGDAIEFARILEREGEAKILSLHKDFGTVKVNIQGKKIDFASTRSETYPHAGHLPKVQKIGCPLENDVIRRDFTINSLAMSLNQDSFGDLIDYMGGYEDLKNKKIKILHDKSFIDDPTRIIRGLKYATRLDFELDKKTLKLQNEYLQNINYDMCTKRIKQEIKKTFEQNTNETLEKFIDQKIYKLITSKKIEIPKTNIKSLIEKYKPKHPWITYFGIVAVVENDEILNKLELTKTEKHIISEAKNLLKTNLKTDYEIYKAFNPQETETLLIVALFGREKEVLHYLEDLKKIKLSINGNDLLKSGFVPSKDFGSAFDYVLQEKLKNPHLKKSEELELVNKFLTSII